MSLARCAALYAAVATAAGCGPNPPEERVVASRSPVGDEEPAPSKPASLASPRSAQGDGVPFSVSVERSVVLAGAAVAIRTGRVSKRESEGLVAALEQGYRRMSEQPDLRIGYEELGPGEGILTMRIDPPGEANTGVVFLHGYGGPFAIQCWHVAEAMKRARPVTLCPSIGTEGAWWTSEGRRLIETTIDRLRRRKIERIILVGLSNGARGAATWASRIERPLDGVVVLSGATGRSPPAGVPVLALSGTNDTMFSPAAGRRYARAAGDLGRFASIPGGHFAFLQHWPDAAGHIDTWLEDQGFVPDTDDT